MTNLSNSSVGPGSFEGFLIQALTAVQSQLINRDHRGVEFFKFSGTEPQI